MGSSFSLTEKTSISIRASQKLGMACPTRASTLPKRSQTVFRFRATRIPMGMDTTTAIRKEATASCKVAGRVSFTSLVTDWRLT